jgi:hypothetical protein
MKQNKHIETNKQKTGNLYHLENNNNQITAITSTIVT